ncbi:MAG: alkaline phosphatase [Gammaproteobacteria bacterium]|nr:alkaline phosphatase [Gammaproteobacteria bacterium]
MSVFFSRTVNKSRVWLWFSACLCLVAAGPAFGDAPRNLILMIPDGMGPAAVTLARSYWGELVMDQILVGSASVASTNYQIPDSAATATAIATGVNTFNRAIAVDDERRPLLTLIESAEKNGMLTGLVVTSPIQHATPAAFTAHVDHRDKYRQIAAQQLEQGVDLMLGGGAKYLAAGPVTDEDIAANDLVTAMALPDQPDILWYPDLYQKAKEAGYQLITTRAELAQARLPVLGIFARDWLTAPLDRLHGDEDDEPDLAEMTRFALDRLAGNDQSFVLLIEGSTIDSAGHYYDPGWLVHDVREFDQALSVALDFARQREDTLLVAMTDHETGGLSLGRMLRDEQVGEKDYSRDWNLDILRRQKATVMGMLKQIRQGGNPVDVFVENTGITTIYPDQKKSLMGIPGMDLDDEDIEEDAMRVIGAVLSSHVKVDWTTRFHTAVDVGVYAYGPGAERFAGYHPNWQIGRMIAELMNLPVAGTGAGREQFAIDQSGKPSKPLE